MTGTIYALSSGAPPAAIAVVRVSGPGADAALEALAGRLPDPRRAEVATLRGRGGEALDRALAIRFPGPNSATGEDIAELHLHGGRAVVAAVLGALAEIEGLRAAEPGEFTRRAFENGRIDLAEAEGLADLLSAETQAQRRAAQALAGGALSRQIEIWRRTLLGLAAEVEAELDFDDEGDVQRSVKSQPSESLAPLRDEIAAWLARPAAERLKDGVSVVIAGPPNAGKSSLLNALAGRDAAITSALPGTTRDVIETPLSLGGLPFVFSDTAGLRDAADEIERIGVERAQARLAVADIVLWLGDPRDAPARSIRVHSKSDIESARDDVDHNISAITGAGLGDLVDALLDAASRLLPVTGDVVLNARHRHLLTLACEALSDAGKAQDPLVAAEMLRQARIALDRVTGRAGVEDMLDALFGRFCIGK